MPINSQRSKNSLYEIVSSKPSSFLIFANNSLPLSTETGCFNSSLLISLTTISISRRILLDSIGLLSLVSNL
jgi:hypothetical protein